MVSRKQLEPMLNRHGFSYFETPGFHSFRRAHPDGSDLMVYFFTWSNERHAARTGVPRAYLVVVLLEGRFRIPLVDWPSEAQARRPVKEVLEELEEVFLNTLDLPTVQHSQLFSTLGTRHLLTESAQ